MGSEIKNDIEEIHKVTQSVKRGVKTTLDK